MEYPHYYELLDMLEPYNISTQPFRIKDHQYKCGYVSLPSKQIVLNEKNSYKGNLETISHEVMHLYYNKVGMDMSEEMIEQLGMKYLNIYPEYYEGLETKLGDLYDTKRTC